MARRRGRRRQARRVARRVVRRAPRRVVRRPAARMRAIRRIARKTGVSRMAARRIVMKAVVRQQRMATMRLRRIIRKANADGNISKREQRRINKFRMRQGIGKMKGNMLLRKITNGKGKGGGNKGNGPVSNPGPGEKVDGVSRDKGGGDKGGGGRGGGDKGKGLGGGIKDDINQAAGGENPTKKYKNFDYKNALQKGAKRAFDRNEAAGKQKAKPLFNNEKKNQKIKSIGDKTGYNKISGRINMMGKLQLKEGQTKAMAPSFKRYEKSIAQTMSPYEKLVGRLTTKAGLSGNQTMRTKQRLRNLSKKLSESRDFGSQRIRKQVMNYGMQGTDLLKKFSPTFKQNVNRKNRKKRQAAEKLGPSGPRHEHMKSKNVTSWHERNKPGKIKPWHER